MKKQFFKFLLKVNNRILPSLYKKDPMKLSNLEKTVLGYRYWVLTKALN